MHDAVRPFIDLETIRRVIEEAAAHRRRDRRHRSGRYGEAGQRRAGRRRQSARDHFARAAGSGADAAGFPLRYAAARVRSRRASDNFTGTDESSLVERLDQVEISVVLGSDRNIKITRPSDMDLARLFFEQETARR